MMPIKHITKRGRSSGRAQMKMMETIFVLIIFLFLLVFGLAFYAGFSKVSGKSRQREDAGLDIMESAQRIQYLPEIQCTKGGTEVVADCFDVMKLKAFNDYSYNNMRYSRIFPNVVLRIEQIYPEDDGEVDGTYYNNTPRNVSMNRFSKEAIQLPITLFDPAKRSYGFGVATIDVYYKW